MKNKFLDKMLMYITTLTLIAAVFSSLSMNVAAEDPPDPPTEEWFVEGEGTYFEITNSSYLNITLTSSENVYVSLKSYPRIVIYSIEGNCSANSTIVTLTGFENNRTYYHYQDSNLMGNFTPDENGSFCYTQDLTTLHDIYIQENTSTVWIKQDGSIDVKNPPYGNRITRIGNYYWLFDDMNIPAKQHQVLIEKSDMVLDGRGYCLEFTRWWGYAICLSRVDNVTIKNFSLIRRNILVHESTNITIENCTLETTWRDCINLLGSSSQGCNYNTITNCKLYSGPDCGGRISGHYAHHTTIKDVTFYSYDEPVSYGIAMGYSEDFTISNCTIYRLDGMVMNDCSNFQIMNCTISNYIGQGIDLWWCQGAEIFNNTISGLFPRPEGAPYSTGIGLVQCDPCTITCNNISNSYVGIGIASNGGHLINANTIQNNQRGIRIQDDPPFEAGDNTFYLNNFIGNSIQYIEDPFYYPGQISNIWYNADLCVGNYWSDYIGVDSNDDGIGDTLTPHPYTNQEDGYFQLDPYPLMDISTWCIGQCYVCNEPPVAYDGGPYSGEEGCEIIFNASDSFDPDDDPLQFRWDFDNDGIWDTDYSTDATATYTWYDDYSGTVVVEVYDGVESDIATTTVTVNNVVPIVDAGPSLTVNEGDLVTIEPTFTDPGSTDTHTATIDWGDGGPVTIIDPATSPLYDSHTYYDNEVYTVTVTVTDDDGGVGTDTLVVTVNDLGPTANAGPDQTIDEGNTINVDGSGSTSHPDAIVLYEWDWTSDGIYDDTGITATSPPYNDDGVYTVMLRVTDDDGSIDTDTLTLTVNDLGPTAEFTWSPEPQDEGSPVQFTDLSTSYPDNIVSWYWDFGDGGTSTLQNPSHTYGDNGIYTVTLTVTDDDGSINSISHDVTINNIAPIANAGIDHIGDEPSTFTFTGSHTDPGTLDTHTYEWDFDYDGVTFDVDVTGNGVSNTWEDDFDGTVALRVTDDDEGWHIDICTVTVNNVAPTITSLDLPIDPLEIGTAVDLTATFTDPGILDTHTATIDWDDGNITTGTITGSSGSYSVTDSWTYDQAGVYTITLTVEDDDGGSDSKTYSYYVVIYDPSAGFVTGGGWILSPEGAYTPDPTLTGKANFGFVSKYKKGQQNPTGNTEFNFKIADMNFHSKDYDWLVVAGAKAMYKGTGTINGAGNYGFILSAIDEDLTPSTDVDLFRIKIWDKDNNDEVIYDNQLGGDDDEDPTTEIGSGNIKIHTGS